MDELDNSVSQEVAPQETTSPDSSTVQQTQEETFQQKNFKQLRERQHQLERDLELQRQMNEKLMQMSQSHSQSKPVEVDEFDSISDDDFIPKGKVKNLVKKEAYKIAHEIAQQETQRMMKAQEQSQFMDKLRRQYSDFDDIVNPETLSLLEQQDPELAATIVESKDPYKIGIQSYKYIKALKLADKAPEARRLKEADKKLEQNAKTVQSPQAYDKRPMAQAFKMTETEKTQIYNEMMGYASQAGFSY